MGLDDDITLARKRLDAAARAAAQEQREQQSALAATMAVQARVKAELAGLGQESAAFLRRAGMRPRRLTGRHKTSVETHVGRGPNGWDLVGCPPLSVDGQFLTAVHQYVGGWRQYRVWFAELDFPADLAWSTKNPKPDWSLALNGQTAVFVWDNGRGIARDMVAEALAQAEWKDLP